MTEKIFFSKYWVSPHLGDAPNSPDMKKFSLYSLCGISLLFFSLTSTKPNVSLLKSKLEGVWKKQTYTDIYEIVHEWQREKYKFISKERFAWMDFDEDTGQVFGTGGGTYTFDGKTYTETLEYYLEDSTVIGTKIIFTAEFKQGKWFHKGVFSTPNGDIQINEVWERAK